MYSKRGWQMVTRKGMYGFNSERKNKKKRKDEKSKKNENLDNQLLLWRVQSSLNAKIQ